MPRPNHLNTLSEPHREAPGTPFFLLNAPHMLSVLDTGKAFLAAIIASQSQGVRTERVETVFGFRSPVRAVHAAERIQKEREDRERIPALDTPPGK